MTPIRDYAKAIRIGRLITDRRNSVQAHCQALIAKRLSEVDAANMAGWLNGEQAVIDCLNGTRWACFRLEDRK